MTKPIIQLLVLFSLFSSSRIFAQPDSIVIKDLAWDKNSPAGMTELFIPSGNAQLAGFIYKANGMQKHPTLLLLHGYPGNERNLDLAQVVRAHGWNVIYFDYRGSWGSPGKFSFKNCVEDVTNVVSFCNKYQDSLKIDTSHIVLFGHSMGGWVCLKSLEQLPQIKKGFALSTWDIYSNFKTAKNKNEMLEIAKNGGEYFVLNSTLEERFTPVINEPGYFNLINAIPKLANKQIIMLDEHTHNKEIATAIQKSNKAYFEYQVWQTDHPFTNKRVSLINKVVAFLDK
jgi:uncharacterized protein